MKHNVFIGKAKGGKIDYGSEANEARLRDCLKKNEGKVFRLEQVKEKRSLSQNSYYWAYLGIIERETGNDAQSLHELFRRTKLPPKFIKVMGKEIKIPMSTTELSKYEFGEYLDKISSETEIALPNPKDLGYYTEY